ncbi:MAG: TetR family transcriptional regulator [Nocardioides sp.]
MIDSAIDRKSATAERITICAQRLTDQHGIDGYTMDDLAEAAEVSRRTLFNYFPRKIDAILGVWPTLDDDDVDEFRSGGPDHDLLQDLRTMILPLFEVELADREQIQIRRRMLLGNPRLLMAVHARYESLSAEIVEHIAVREGPTFGALRAQVAVRVLAALFDSALDEFLLDPRERSIVHHFDEALRTARSLFGV